MTNRNARLSGTIVSGSNEAFSARQPTIKHPPCSRCCCELHQLRATIYNWTQLNTRVSSSRYHCSPAIGVREATLSDTHVRLLDDLGNGTSLAAADLNS